MGAKRKQFPFKFICSIDTQSELSDTYAGDPAAVGTPVFSAFCSGGATVVRCVCGGK